MTLTSGTGTCRDFALLMIEACRSPRLRRPLRHRLPLLRVPQQEPPPRRRRHPRLGAGVLARRRLGRVRPDERDRRERGPDPGRRGARPEAGQAAQRELCAGRGGVSGNGGAGECDAGGRAGASPRTDCLGRALAARIAAANSSRATQ